MRKWVVPAPHYLTIREWIGFNVTRNWRDCKSIQGESLKVYCIECMFITRKWRRFFMARLSGDVRNKVRTSWQILFKVNSTQSAVLLAIQQLWQNQNLWIFRFFLFQEISKWDVEIKQIKIIWNSLSPSSLTFSHPFHYSDKSFTHHNLASFLWFIPFHRNQEWEWHSFISPVPFLHL